MAHEAMEPERKAPVRPDRAPATFGRRACGETETVFAPALKKVLSHHRAPGISIIKAAVKEALSGQIGVADSASRNRLPYYNLMEGGVSMILTNIGEVFCRNKYTCKKTGGRPKGRPGIACSEHLLQGVSEFSKKGSDFRKIPMNARICTDAGASPARPYGASASMIAPMACHCASMSATRRNWVRQRSRLCDGRWIRK